MPSMRWRLLLPIVLGFAFGPGAFGAEVIPPAPEHYFNDYAGVVPAGLAGELDQRLEQFERASSNQIIVAIFPRMESPSSIEDYTVRVAQSWRAGQKAKDNGAVLFIFRDDHKLYIQVGYGLEGALPDALCKRIIEDEIVPRFHAGDLPGGVTAGVNALIAATKGEYQGMGSTVADAGRTGDGTGTYIFIGLMVALFIFTSMVRTYTAYSGSGRRSGWLTTALVLGSLFNGGGGRGSSGGFGGGGGFSGGGGSFGGGGAGGSW